MHMQALYSLSVQFDTRVPSPLRPSPSVPPLFQTQPGYDDNVKESNVRRKTDRHADSR